MQINRDITSYYNTIPTLLLPIFLANNPTSSSHAHIRRSFSQVYTKYVPLVVRKYIEFNHYYREKRLLPSKWN